MTHIETRLGELEQQMLAMRMVVCAILPSSVEITVTFEEGGPTLEFLCKLCGGHYRGTDDAQLRGFLLAHDPVICGE